MRRCADLADCGHDNRDNDRFCRACALPLLSTALAGRYVVEALISKGGYAAVFRGVDQNLSRRIAIKLLLPNKTTPTEQEHFLREARISATLDHPNIAPILDYGKDGPSVFLVMPLYTSGSLRTRLAVINGPLPAAETIHDFHQLVNALHYAHTRPRPVIHRDIKPENILIHQEDHRLVITDFGIARSLEPGERVEKTITVRGTVGYMAPEQSNGVVDPRSDQFGCAVVLYEMLTGYNPFDERGGPILPPSTFNMELPSALDTVVLRALAARPEDRFVDMLEFMYAFDQAIRPSSGLLALAQNSQADTWSNPIMRQSANPSSPAIQVGTRRGDSSGSQHAVRKNTSGSVREKCQQGDQLLKQQHYSQALHAYEEALSIEPRNFYAWNGKADTEMDLNQPEEAIASYEQALNYDQHSFQAWNGLGNARSYLRDYAGAVGAYSRALLINPRSAVAWCNKAEALVRYGHNRAALDALNEATELDRSYARAWTLKAEVYESLGNHQEAQKARKRAKPWGLMG